MIEDESQAPQIQICDQDGARIDFGGSARCWLLAQDAAGVVTRIPCNVDTSTTPPTWIAPEVPAGTVFAQYEITAPEVEGGIEFFTPRVDFRPTGLTIERRPSFLERLRAWWNRWRT